MSNGLFPTQHRTDSSSWNEFVEHVRNHRRIDAIKLLRGVSNLGLKESKDLVEAFEATDNASVVRMYFGLSNSPGAQLAFEHGTVIFMPSTGEVKIEGVFTPVEWKHMNRILAAIDANWG